MAAAFASARPVAAIVFDLDHFKLINDTFGHRTGDGVIQRFAGLVARTLRHDDLVGRMGGEEFAVVLPGASREAARLITEMVSSALAQRRCRIPERCWIHSSVESIASITSEFGITIEGR